MTRVHHTVTEMMPTAEDEAADASADSKTEDAGARGPTEAACEASMTEEEDEGIQMLVFLLK